MASSLAQYFSLAPWVALVFIGAMGQDDNVTVAVQALREAQTVALPQMLDALDVARAAGVDNATLAAAATIAQIRSVADLSLLGAVTAVAGNTLTGLAAGLKEALATDVVDSGRIHAAFELAERAGVQAEERDAARQSVDSEFQSRLTAAKAALEINRTVENMKDLAAAINVGSTLSLNQTELEDARRVFETLLDELVSSGNTSLVEQVVELADLASATVPTQLRGWASAMPVVRHAAALPENRTEHLAQLLAALRLSKATNLPRTGEMATVEAKARVCAAARLKEMLPEVGNATGRRLKEVLSERTSSQGVDASLLEALEIAREANVSVKELAVAEGTILSLAEVQLQRSLNTSLRDTNAIKEVFAVAERVGVSADTCSAARLKMENKLQEQLTAAKTAVEANSTAEAIEALAYAIQGGLDLGLNQTEVAGARKLYEELARASLVGTDMALVEQIVAFADHVQLTVPRALIEWAGAMSLVREAAALPEDQTVMIPQFLHVMRRSKEVGLPRTDELVTVESKAQTCAALRVNETLAGPLDIYALTVALEIARELGVPAHKLVVAVQRAKAFADGQLKQVLATNLSDVNVITSALDIADRTGVNSTLARAELNTQVQTRLRTAMVAMTDNRSIQAIEDLAHIINVGNRLSFQKSELDQAKLLYELQFNGNITEVDFGLVERAVALADLATAKVPANLHGWVAAARRLREAAELPEDDSEFLQLALRAMSDADAVGLPGIKDFNLVKAKAKARATAALHAVTSGDGATSMQTAIETAVVAGVPEADLEAARTVISAQTSL